jgi:hypothetical protein
VLPFPYLFLQHIKCVLAKDLGNNVISVSEEIKSNILPIGDIVIVIVLSTLKESVMGIKSTSSGGVIPRGITHVPVRSGGM